MSIYEKPGVSHVNTAAPNAPAPAVQIGLPCGGYLLDPATGNQIKIKCKNPKKYRGPIRKSASALKKLW